MIPKTIHYCWFGRGEKPRLAKKCISSWRKHCPDYQIIEWNEDNYDIAAAPLFVRQAIENKKWAFATDYVRLKVIHDHGGVYLDTDVELLKSLDGFLQDHAFFGFEYEGDKYRINSGLGFGAEKNTQILRDLMETYESTSFVLPNGDLNLTWNSVKETAVFVDHGLQLDGTTQVLDQQVHVYPDRYFHPLKNGYLFPRITPDTVSIHWYASSWWPNGARRKHFYRIHRNRVVRRIDSIGTKILGADRYLKYKRTLRRH